MPTKQPPLVVTINSSGRQAASFVRVASAVGWLVRAQLRDRKGIVAEELETLPNVTLVDGELTDQKLIDDLFKGAQLAFINTTHWGDEIKIGCALADAAKKAGIEHYIYSSMPDHSSFAQGWKALPMWKPKHDVERYIRSIGIASTFVYCGVYNNNFTSLPYPLFQMDLQPDGTFIWQAPFAPNEPIPWLDTEHDMGPALLQIFKEGPKRWGGHSIPITFEIATPLQICESFSRALSRPVTYRLGRILFAVPVPPGYKDHLLALEKTLGSKELGFDQAPYFGPTMYYPEEAIQLWEGNRGMREYAREAFLEEERANGLTWMDEDEEIDDLSNIDEEGGGEVAQSEGGSTMSANDHKPADAESL